MATTMPTIRSADIDELYLDPSNPRLGRHEIDKGLRQDQVLELMQDWSLEELAVSFLESGFWPQESLIAVREALPGQSDPVLVVVEGNRRLAALKLLQQARALRDMPPWDGFVAREPADKLDALRFAPYIEMPDRRSVSGYLGYRHVTGIKEWSPAEKAQFIAHLIENEGLTYDQVRRRIGSKAPTVRQHYVAYRLLVQMEDETRAIDVSRVEDRFSVLYRSVRTAGVQKYLRLNLDVPPAEAKRPVPSDRLEQLVRLTGWLFGTEKRQPVLTDSRDLDAFARVLESGSGTSYLERTAQPILEVARRAAGVSQDDLAESVEAAAYKVEDALAVVHQFKADPQPRLTDAVRRLGSNALQLLSIFPEVEAELRGGKS